MPKKKRSAGEAIIRAERKTLKRLKEDGSLPPHPRTPGPQEDIRPAAPDTAAVPSDVEPEVEIRKR